MIERPGFAYPELSALIGPNVPDLRGLFLRGYGSQTYAQNNGSTIGVTSTLHESGELGQVQGDAMRNASGNASAAYPNGVIGWEAATGLFYGSNYTTTQNPATWAHRAMNHNINVDFSRVLPTAAENRPVNTAVRYLVRARP